MAKQEETSKSAKILYRPIGLTSSILGGLLAGIIFKQVWTRAKPGDQPDPPTALESEYDLKEILVAATIQGAIYSLVKTLIDRSGPGHSSAELVNGPVAEAIRHAKHHAAGMAPLQA